MPWRRVVRGLGQWVWVWAVWPCIRAMIRALAGREGVAAGVSWLFLTGAAPERVSTLYRLSYNELEHEYTTTRRSCGYGMHFVC